MSDLAIIVPVFNRVEFTKKFIQCLNQSTYKLWTLFIVDDGSTDDTSELLGEVSIEITPESQVIMDNGVIYHIQGDGNWWWTKSINRAVEVALRSGAQLILTQNNDVEFPNNYLEKLMEAHQVKPNVIITAPIFDLNTGQCLPDGGGVRRNWFTAKDIKLPVLSKIPEATGKVERYGEAWRELTHCSGRGCLIPAVVFYKIGLYDEKHLPQYAADDDFTYRAASAGFPIFIYLNTYCLTPAEETGLTEFLSIRSWKTFVGYLNNQKSPANIRRRYWITVRHCRPRWYTPISFLLDLIRVTASYWLKTSVVNK